MIYELYQIILLITIIILIVIFISKIELHPFLTLLFAGILFGLFSGMKLDKIISSLLTGFGSTLSSIGIVIVAGTIIGVFLEKTGSAYKIAESLLKLFKKNNVPAVMNVMGFIIAIPVFCDSGFVILSTLNKALTKKAGLSLSITALALSLGLYATHTMVPPTPGPVAATGILQADLGLVIILGILVSIPVAISGLIFAKVYGKKIYIEPEINIEDNHKNINYQVMPSLLVSIMPILIPILLIILKSISEFPNNPLNTSLIKTIINFAGNPSIALLIGFFFCLLLPEKIEKNMLSAAGWVGEGIKNAAIIILITAAGGSFGQILRDSPLSGIIGNYFTKLNIGLLLPFIIAAALKTAQGSSTVAIITTAYLILPLLEPMHFTTDIAKGLAVVAIGEA
jgi:GntP family gluconate:H+ symporter